MLLNQRIFNFLALFPVSVHTSQEKKKKKKNLFPSVAISLYFLALFLLHKGSWFKNIF